MPDFNLTQMLAELKQSEFSKAQQNVAILKFDEYDAISGPMRMIAYGDNKKD